MIIDQGHTFESRNVLMDLFVFPLFLICLGIYFQYKYLLYGPVFRALCYHLTVDLILSKVLTWYYSRLRYTCRPTCRSTSPTPATTSVSPPPPYPPLAYLTPSTSPRHTRISTHITRNYEFKPLAKFCLRVRYIAWPMVDFGTLYIVWLFCSLSGLGQILV